MDTIKEIGPILVGSVLGKYEILQPLGNGSMGEVYLARHQDLGREMAIKVLNRSLCDDQDALGRFKREARAANRIPHKSVVQIVDFDTLEDGRSYCVMEVLRGQTLGQYLDRYWKVAVAQTYAIMTPIMGAVGMAHAHGIIHRDIKPDNIFLHKDHDGTLLPKILDFGLAKLATRNTDSSSVITRAGRLMGTPLYMSPEQAAGRNNDVGPWSDIYSMGAVIYHMLTGSPPFIADSVLEILVHHVETPPVPLRVLHPTVSPELDSAIQTALAKDPQDRYPSMQAFLTHLEATTSDYVRKSAEDTYRGPRKEITGRPAEDTDPDLTARVRHPVGADSTDRDSPAPEIGSEPTTLDAPALAMDATDEHEPAAPEPDDSSLEPQSENTRILQPVFSVEKRPFEDTSPDIPALPPEIILLQESRPDPPIEKRLHESTAKDLIEVIREARGEDVGDSWRTKFFPATVGGAGRDLPGVSRDRPPPEPARAASGYISSARDSSIRIHPPLADPSTLPDTPTLLLSEDFTPSDDSTSPTASPTSTEPLSAHPPANAPTDLVHTLPANSQPLETSVSLAISMAVAITVLGIFLVVVGYYLFRSKDGIESAPPQPPRKSVSATTPKASSTTTLHPGTPRPTASVVPSEPNRSDLPLTTVLYRPTKETPRIASGPTPSRRKQLGKRRHRSRALDQLEPLPPVADTGRGGNPPHTGAAASEKPIAPGCDARCPNQNKGCLWANTSPKSTIYINGRNTGKTTPVFKSRAILLPAGRHVVMFVTADGRRHTEVVRIKTCAVARLIRRLKAKPRPAAGTPARGRKPGKPRDVEKVDSLD